MTKPAPRAPEPYRFDEVHLAPASPGLYAWYHQFQLSGADIRAFGAALSHKPTEERRETTERFLMEHVFGTYRETDYEVEVTGKLKPEYKGRVAHRPRMSDALVKVATETPDELAQVAELLHRSVPYFASPIYIGVAKKSLRARLSTHHTLLAQYRENAPVEPLNSDDVDHSFAYEAVCVRRIVPSELLVYAMPVEFPERIAVATEYILNRINYPLCGRN